MINKAVNNTWLAIIAAILLAADCHGAQSSQLNDDAQVPAQGAAPDPVKHRILSFNLEGVTEKGAKKWDVTGESAEAITSDRIKLDNIVARAYGEDALATITADKGIYDKSHNNVRLEQNVKATIDSAGSAAGNIGDFPGASPAQSAGKKPANPQSPSKKTRTVITCDGEVQFDYEKNEAYFSKNVKVVNEEGSIDADRITIYLDMATKKLKEIVAEGNVKIRRGENTTYSDRAVYIDAEKKILLTGSPKLIIYQEGNLEENILGK